MRRRQRRWGKSKPSRPRLQTNAGPTPVSCFWPAELEILGASVCISLQKIPLLGSFIVKCQEEMYLYKQKIGIFKNCFLVVSVKTKAENCFVKIQKMNNVMFLLQFMGLVWLGAQSSKHVDDWLMYFRLQSTSSICNKVLLETLSHLLAWMNFAWSCTLEGFSASSW